MTPVAPYLFVGKVRIMYKRADIWTAPGLFTDKELKTLMEDDTLQAAQFVPLEGKTFFTIAGVGNISVLDLTMKD